MAARNIIKGKVYTHSSGTSASKVVTGPIRLKLTVKGPSAKLQAEKRKLVEEMKRLDADAAKDGLQIRGRSGITMRLKDPVYQ